MIRLTLNGYFMREIFFTTCNDFLGLSMFGFLSTSGDDDGTECGKQQCPLSSHVPEVGRSLQPGWQICTFVENNQVV